ncbi:hypothetical protein V6N13_062380 [Hibiscus sabdariffa]|uniref:Bulb-type lectin domain-containing protein n=1 Tax=Hibiscus sabdariffa TaxID=183260 RepID=A0ABR2BQA3_9ROSI
MNWIDKNGLFLVPNSSEFGFGFVTTSDVTLFLLVIMHMETTKVIWAANRNFPVSNSDISLFQNDGNMLLKKGQSVVWKTNTGDKGYSNPQSYWSMGKDSRRNINKNGGVVTSASIDENSWKFFDESKVLL